MKKLTCEMCGSNELVKQNGMFICQSCGTKYSVEEAKKMMIEGSVDVSGSTVKVDSLGNIDNYYNLASNAYDSHNFKEAETYCNKIIEIDPNNCKAWYLKGLSVGWSSTLSNDRMWEAKNCFEKAISYAKGEEKGSLQNKSVDDILDLFIAMIDLWRKHYVEFPSPENCNGMMDKYHQFEKFSSGFNEGTSYKKLCETKLQTVVTNVLTSIAEAYPGIMKECLASDVSCENFLIQSQFALSAAESIVDKLGEVNETQISLKNRCYEFMISMQNDIIDYIKLGARLNYSSCKLDTQSMEIKINKWSQEIKKLDPNYVISERSLSRISDSREKNDKIIKIFGRTLVAATLIGGLIFILCEMHII